MIAQDSIPIAIAFMVAYVGWLQLRTARAKFRLDLFDKRIDCFNATRGVFAAAHFQDGIQSEYSAFLTVLPKSEFLFDKDVSGYLKIVNAKVQQLRMTGVKLRANTERSQICNSSLGRAEHDAVARQLIVEQAEIVSWMGEQDDRCRAVFKPYMAFGKW